MKLILVMMLLWQTAPSKTIRDEKTELNHGQAILRSRFDKDEAAFKALSKPTDVQVEAEHDMQLCFSVARSTEGMYHIPAGQGMKPNCDRQFIALETDVNQR